MFEVGKPHISKTVATRHVQTTHILQNGEGEAFIICSDAVEPRYPKRPTKEAANIYIYQQQPLKAKSDGFNLSSFSLAFDNLAHKSPWFSFWRIRSCFKPSDTCCSSSPCRSFSRSSLQTSAECSFSTTFLAFSFCFSDFCWLSKSCRKPTRVSSSATFSSSSSYAIFS